MEPFTLIEETNELPHSALFSKFVNLGSAPNADHDTQYLTALRGANPDSHVITIPEPSASLRAFAAAGNATCELDTETDSFTSWRGYVPAYRRGEKGSIGENVHYGKYRYNWANEDFTLYVIGAIQYVVKERRKDEHTLGPSRATDALILAIGEWRGSDENVVWVFDGYWRQDKKLWEEVQKANWGKVILDEQLKKDVTSTAEVFFSSKQVYEDLGVPWKRGIMLHGPPGNGKTISIKALMHTLLDRENPIPTLYVKSAPNTNAISAVFLRARALSPCMLILEDIETIVTPATRSYFFNELDGIAGNDGLFVVASTNYLDRLDPGLTQRPSRFDRKYLFPLPSEESRVKYCEFWRAKLAKNKNLEFPHRLCRAMARITDEFSFAFLQECFVASLLQLARDMDQEVVFVDDGNDDDDDDLKKYPLWVVFRKEAAILRQEIHQTGERARDSLAFQPGGNINVAPPPTDLLLPETLSQPLMTGPVTHSLLQRKFPHMNTAAQDWW